MARTLTVIYDALIDEKETFTSLDTLVPNPDAAQDFLDDLTTPSKVAVWRLFTWVVAVGIWTHEQLFDQHKAAVELLSTTLVTGTLRWYRERALEFQLGDTLQFINDIFQYPVIDVSKQIVKRSAAIEGSGQVRIKVAKEVATVLVPLSASEEVSFTSYMNQIKFAGTNLAVINLSADTLKVDIKVVYDALVLSTTGELIDTPGTFPVEDAINNFLDQLPFDGVLNLTQLVDAIQAAEGVVDPILNSVQARTGAVPYAEVVENYTAVAGYMIIDPAFPLDNIAVIQYVAN